MLHDAESGEGTLGQRRSAGKNMRQARLPRQKPKNSHAPPFLPQKHGQRGLSEVGIRHLAHRGRHVEVILALEAEHARDNTAGERLAFVAIIAHVAVEEPSCRLNPVLGFHQLALKLQEVLVGL